MASDAVHHKLKTPAVWSVYPIRFASQSILSQFEKRGRSVECDIADSNAKAQECKITPVINLCVHLCAFVVNQRPVGRVGRVGQVGTLTAPVIYPHQNICAICVIGG